MDPTKPIPFVPAPPKEEEDATLAEALQTQLKLARTIQNRLNDPSEALDPREFKELVNAASSIVSLAHRSDQALREIETYKKFAATVLEFLRRRGDQIGEDLVSELHGVAEDLHVAPEFRSVTEARGVRRD